MTENRSARFDIGHTAPGSSRVGAGLLLATFLAGFVVWSLQLAANSAIAGLACLAGDGTRTRDSAIGWAGLGVELINLAALALAAGAVVLSIVLIRRAAEADPHPEGGVMRSGEGRAQFMAVWCLSANVLFLFAIAFNTVTVFWGGLCPA